MKLYSNTVLPVRVGPCVRARTSARACVRILYAYMIIILLYCYICVRVCVYVFVRVCTYVHTNVYAYVRAGACAYACAYMSARV